MRVSGTSSPLTLAQATSSTAVTLVAAVNNATLAVPPAPAVARVIGAPSKKVLRGSTVGLHAGAGGTLPTAGPLPVPWRYDDHYGFNSLNCIE
jgi:hypothetical protein